MKKKAEIRKKMKLALKTFDSSDKQRQTQAIMTQFLASDLYQQAQTIAAFMPMSFEFDMTGLLADTTKRLVIPKTLPQRQMIFTDYDENALFLTPFGVRESKSDIAVVPDLIIVPGLAWTADGYRIGYGGGYYDRYLADFTGQTVSFVYDFQMLPTIERNKFDIPVRHIFKV
ncbi:5-formyltetrahydrofolate cyclo-ligase [Bacilli bacterium]|nr:5-formyltetrahydrofolate cyclo-ligase [Bacilli bacterium]GHU39968.1 5-formyltetrahydrofolate cyclo-ligase [Bacilli bacterium]